MGATEFIEDMPSHVLKLILLYNTAVSGLPFSSPGDLPDPGIEPRSLAFQMNSLPSKPPAAAVAKSLQSCLTLCNPKDGSSAHGIFQARVLEWGAIAFSDYTVCSWLNHRCITS